MGGDRLDFDAGDMFEGVTAGADGYLLASILHDWDDERALAILRNVRRAIAPGGRLLLVEEVLPGGTEPSPARLLDLLMLVLVGVGSGRSRSSGSCWPGPGLRWWRWCRRPPGRA